MLVSESQRAIRALCAKASETCELQKQLAFCVEVFEAQLYEMGSEGNISTHVSEGKVEELRKLIETKHEEERE